ncbi:BT4734/BF3469 family protein [Eudoraea chungangensis]|uniref:BT4734/BF3469 family protein n=1 Tax=Eudoraea chungangensis TaxID=1481905 RepID=UPI0023EC828A|nr:BT4734/BF3469 family protein [Eudoraea chungangensis]
MINSYNNIYSPQVNGEIDIYDYLDRIGNPDPRTKKLILLAREYKMNGDEVGYQKIKESLVCHTLNFSFNSKKSNENIIAPTGFIYLDVDNVDKINLSNHYVFSAWRSLSGAGYGLLVKVDGLTLENFKSTYESLGKELGIPLDSMAAKATQFTIQSYDKDLYLNNDSISWMAITTNTPTSSPYKKKKKRYTTEMGEEETIKYDNLHEIDFDGQDYLVFPDEKYQAAKAFVPRVILSGNRNSTLYSIGYQFKALNPNISLNYLSKKMHGINNGCCLPPMSENEVDKIILSIYELQDLEPFSNYPRRVVFNPETDLSVSEKRKIVNKVTGAIRSQKTLASLVSAVYNWDYWIDGRITQRKLKEHTKKNIKTIEKYYKQLKDIG